MTSVLFFIIFAVVQARFGQENIPIPAIQQIKGGPPGVADTVAGEAISDILAGANACAKLQRGDLILAELGEGTDAVLAAIGMVVAEKNFNPFAQDAPTICGDAGLPQNALLRGITPLIDPAVVGANVANALSARTKILPLDAENKSVADLFVENGFTNFTTQAAAGNASGPTVTNGNNAATTNATSNSGSCSNTIDGNNGNDTKNGTSSNTTMTGNGEGSGADFGMCDPTMSFKGGRNGRPATEFTFQSNDANIVARQQEALNPNIIANRICDDLVNICGANKAALSVCANAKLRVQALGTRDQSTANAWNALITGNPAARKLLRRRGFA